MASRIHFHTPDELADLLATVLAGAAPPGPGVVLNHWGRFSGPLLMQ